MTVQWQQISDDDRRHYDMVAESYAQSIKAHSYQNAKDWLNTLVNLDKKFAEQGEP